MLGRALSCLNMTMALIKGIKLSQSGWHSKPVKGWKDCWVASNSFKGGFSGKGSGEEWTVGLLMYCSSTFNKSSYSSHFYWKKNLQKIMRLDIQIMTTPTLGWLQMSNHFWSPKSSWFDHCGQSVYLKALHTFMHSCKKQDMTWYSCSVLQGGYGGPLQMSWPNPYKDGKILVLCSVGLQPRQTILRKDIMYSMLVRC